MERHNLQRDKNREQGLVLRLEWLHIIHIDKMVLIAEVLEENPYLVLHLNLPLGVII